MVGSGAERPLTHAVLFSDSRFASPADSARWRWPGHGDPTVMPSPQTMVVYVNDASRMVASGARLSTLLEEIALGGRQSSAVAVNAVVVPRASWTHRILQENDRVIIIQASQGG